MSPNPAAYARATLTGAAVATAAFGMIGLTAPAAAADSPLCLNYSACADVRMTDHGYGSIGYTSVWGMYAGHNCTNYVAYALQREGVRRPAYRLGNAAEWGPAAAAAGVPVDDDPVVGAVAWWSSGAGGVSWAGHVAIVEKIDATSITISEDNYPYGPFDWRVIPRGSTSWPTGFIHFGVTDAPRRPSVAHGAQGLTAIAATRSDGALELTVQTRPGAPWTTRTVAPAGSATSAPSLVLGADGTAEIAVQGARGTLAVFGRPRGAGPLTAAGSWTVEMVAGPGAVTAAPTAVLTRAGQLQVVTRGARGALTVYAADVTSNRAAPGGAGATVRVWTTTSVAGAGAVQSRPAVTLDPSGRTRVAVLGAAHRLVLYTGNPSGVWTSTAISRPGAAFAEPSIVDGPGAQLQVSTLGADGSVDVYGDSIAAGGAVHGGLWAVSSLSAPGAAATAPMLVVGADGTTSAAATTADGALVLFSTAPVVAGWGQASSLLRALQTVSRPGAAVSPAQVSAGPGGREQIMAINGSGVLDIYRRSATGAWVAETSR